MELATTSGQWVQKAEILALMPKNITPAEREGFDDAVFGFRKTHNKDPDASQIAKYWRDKKGGKQPQAAKVLDVTAQQKADISRALTETHAKRGEDALEQRRAAEENTRLTREDGGSKKKRKRGSNEASSNGSKDRHDHSGQAPRQKSKGILAQSIRKLPPR